MFHLIAAVALYSMPDAPVAARVPFEVAAPGGVRTDHYYWLRDASNPGVLEYLEAENAYAEAWFAATGADREALYQEMAARLPEDDVSVPWELGGWWYGTRYEAGAEYPVHFRSHGSPDSVQQVLFDMNRLAGEREYFSLEAMSVSPDGNLVALCLDTLGGHRGMTVFLDAPSGTFLPDTLHDTSGDMAWGADSRTFFYGFLDGTGRTQGFCRYVPGSGSEPVEVFIEPDSTYWPWMYESTDRSWIVIGSESASTSRFLLIPASDPLLPPRQAAGGEEGVLCSITFTEDSLYILTNRDAENFRLLRTTVFSTDEPAEVIPHDPAVLLERIYGFRSHIVVMDRVDGRQGIRIREVPGGSWTRVRLPDEPASIYASTNLDFDPATFRIDYSSLVTPWSTISCDLKTGGITFLKTDHVAGYDPSLYGTASLMVPARDGEKVPVSLVYRTDLFSEGECPLLLYGYGAYGYSNDPVFGSSDLSLLDRGFVYAIAHVRGGQEMGRSWYTQGRLLSKMNTFNDFIDCAQYLGSQGWCDPDRIFAMGESAGGLLIGAVANMRPDLWRGLVAGVPFVDVVTTMLDETVPLTTNEYSEWGNPADPVFYDYMLAYSPYDNVAPADYPAMLVTAGLHDSQVGFWEPAKWVAAMRHAGTGSEPLLFMTNMGAGHGGSSGRYSWLADLAAKYAFLISLAETVPQ